MPHSDRCVQAIDGRAVRRMGMLARLTKGMSTIAVTMDLYDAALVAQAKAGESDALAGLYRRHARALYTLALRMTANPATAEDMAQEAFLRAARALPGFRGDAPVGAWLKRLVANAVIDHLRKQRPEAAAELIDTMEAVAVPPGAALDAIGLLRRLAPDARSVVLLHEMEGYSHPEIAAMFGKTASWSKTVLARSIARLHAWLEEES